MSTNETQTANWNDVLDYKAKILYAQIVSLQQGLREQGGSEEMIDAVCAPYLETLKTLYLEDYPLAKAIEQSDLLVRLEGPAISRDNPRISIIAGELAKVRAQVGKVAKSIAELSSNFRGVPDEMDLGLSAFAKGSLILGFTVPTATEVAEGRDGQESLFGEQDPFFKAAREAIRTIGIVTKHVTEDGSPDDLSSLVPDPKVRDTALSAVKELSPSGRTGISSVRLSGKSITDLEVKQPLTVKTRETIRKRIERPLIGPSVEPPVTIIGYVREMDLDNKRFELRHLEGLEVSDVRCVYVNETDEEAKQWLNTRARVTGVVERDPAGKVRLLETTSIEILSQP
jgi:hypothetical protein